MRKKYQGQRGTDMSLIRYCTDQSHRYNSKKRTSSMGIKSNEDVRLGIN